jgi:hypothetical protein
MLFSIFDNFIPIAYDIKLIVVMMDKPMLCEYCKKLIRINDECFEEHEGKYYHADCMKKN